MLNPTKYVRAAYISLLGGISSGSMPVPIFDKLIPSSTPIPPIRILIETQTSAITAENKCGHQWLCTILLDIIYEQNTSFVNSATLDDIEQQISDIIDLWTSGRIEVAIPPFIVNHTTFAGSHSIEVQTPTLTITRRLVRYQHRLSGNVS